MKSSIKKLTLSLDSETQPLHQQQPEEATSNKEEENPEAQMEDNQEDEEVAEEEEEEEQQQQAQQQQEAPKLEEGFYEIEAIRRKRVRKGQQQYLIKWRGWPESANTWEPIDNLQSCSDVIDAFEERLLKSSRKRKRKYTGSNVTLPVAKNRRGSSIERNAEIPNQGGAQLDGGGNGLRVEGEEANGSVPNVVKIGEQKEDGGHISLQFEEDGLVENRSSKVECNQPLQGAKKRKSGCVRRFKQDDVKLQSNGGKLGSEDVDSTEDDNGERHKVDEVGNPPYITKILKAVSYCASVTNNEQQVSIIFKALRSDGQEVLVDDKDLKVNSPLVLINYYEQHLRYSPNS